jgi:hypothetical protein
MGTLSQPLAINVIRAFRGIVDFYYWKGIPVFRKWPTRFECPNTPKQQAAWATLRVMHERLRAQGPAWHTRWSLVDCPVGRSLEDLKRKTALWNLNAGFSTPEPVLTKIERYFNPTANQTYFRLTHGVQAGLTPALLRWRYQEYTSKVPRLQWQDFGTVEGREKYVIPNVQPDKTHWLLPAGETYDAVLLAWQFTLQGKVEDVALLCEPIPTD